MKRRSLPSFAAPIFFISVLLFASCGTRSRAIPASEWMAREASATFSSMTVEEKASQVLMTGIDGKDVFPAYLLDHFRGVVPGAVLLFRYNIAGSPSAVHDYLASCDRAFLSLDSRSRVLFAIDHEGGDVFRTAGVTSPLPSARFVAEHFSSAAAEKLYELSGEQLDSLGIGMNLAPVAESETPFNAAFLGTRAYSGRSETVEAYARAAVRGYKSAGVLTVLKHFPGNGEGDPHTGLPRLDVSRKVLLEKYVGTFKSSLADKPDAVLVSHIVVPSVDAVPFCLSRAGVTGILRESLGFRGVIMTDDIAMAALSRNGYKTKDAALAALRAGCDMIMISDRSIRSIASAIAEEARSDPAFAKRLDEAVWRILEMKARAGYSTTARERCWLSRYGRYGAIPDFFPDRFAGARKKAARLVEDAK
jgi:beta-N-acetylhexosaminidase